MSSNITRDYKLTNVKNEKDVTSIVSASRVHIQVTIVIIINDCLEFRFKIVRFDCLLDQKRYWFIARFQFEFVLSIIVINFITRQRRVNAYRKRMSRNNT